MNKKQRIIRGSISILLGLLMLVAFIVLGKKDWQQVKPKDSTKFHEQYSSVPAENVYVYKSLPEINRTLESGSGVVFFCYKESKWCQQYAVYVNEVAKEMSIDKIMYFDIYHDRENNTKDYIKTVNLLKEYLPINDDNERIIKFPNLVVIKEGIIMGNNNDTALIYATEENAVEDYWTEEKIDDFKNTIKQMFMNLKEEDLISK